MIDSNYRLMLFVRDFTGKGGDLFYWFEHGHLQKTDAGGIVAFAGVVLCHDFWMVRDALFDQTGTLPGRIVDIDELRISVSGVPEDRIAREKQDVSSKLGRYGATQEVCDTYRKMFYKGVAFDESVAVEAATAIVAMYVDICKQASEDGELERFFDVEVPVYRLFQLAMSAGILVDGTGLSEMRSEAEHDYFLSLKSYSAKHDMPLETPTKRAIVFKWVREGYELDEVSVEYLLEFVPHELDFGGDTRTLLALDTARRVLASLTLNSNKVRPVVDVFGSRTSRIQLRSPSLQNIPKRFRSIICAQAGAKLSYVDFDQFEVGIMAALSEDDELKSLYAAGDMYDLFANTHLGLVGNRKAAKQLFLSYAYGMSRKALVDAAYSLGVDRQKAKTAFGRFQRFEDWKKLVWIDFQRTNRVTTLFGNHYKRNGRGQLTGREQRSAISQVIQGTASLIFKRATLAISTIDDVKLVLPMHDAILFEHRCAETPGKVVKVFEGVMTEILEGRVTGKASISEFI